MKTKEYLTSLNSYVITNFIAKVASDDTEITIYDQDSNLIDVVSIHMFNRWKRMNSRVFQDGCIMINNKSGEFIKLQDGVWLRAENCKYRGYKND